MRIDTKTLLAFAAMTLMSPGFAGAADYDPPIFVEEAAAAEYVPVEIGSGWYLRGDVSYNADRSPYDFEDSLAESDSVRAGASVGVGYHFNDYLRGDLNLGFVSWDRQWYPDSPIGEKFENQVWNGMANAYVDLGTYVGFTPYVGAGVGVLYSRNKLEIDDEADIDDQKAVDDQYEFAYSLAAGASYQIARNTSVDLGYQYLSSPGTEYVGLDGSDDDKGLDYHQVRVGLRYDLW